MESYDCNKALLEAVKARLDTNASPVWFIMDVLSAGRVISPADNHPK